MYIIKLLACVALPAQLGSSTEWEGQTVIEDEWMNEKTEKKDE